MIRNIDLNHYKKEKCIDCGTIFEQWEDSHLEHCPTCRIVRALERLCEVGI